MEGESMAYVKAVLGVLGAALLFGAGTGVFEVLTDAVTRLRPEDKAIVYSMGISEAVNCAAFFAVVLIPLALILVFVIRRWRRRPASGTST